MSVSEMLEKCDEYRRQPLSWIHPGWIELCFEPVQLSAGHLDELLSRSRFQARLVDMLKKQHSLPDIPELEAHSESDLAVISFPLSLMDRLIRACGVVYWAKAFSTVVVSSQVTQLRNHFGQELYQLALDNREMGAETSAPETLGDLEAAIESDGVRCFKSWLLDQDPELQAWQRLKVPHRLLEDSKAESSPTQADITRHMAHKLWPKQELMEVQDDRVNG